MSDLSPAEKALATLQAAYRTRLDPATIDVYTSALADLKDPGRVLRAVQSLLASSTRFPSIAEVREAYRHAPAARALERQDVGDVGFNLVEVRRLRERMGWLKGMS